MKRFVTLEELSEPSLSSTVCAIFKRALQTEHEISHPKSYDPDTQGSVWLLQSTDTDETLVSIFGTPLLKLSFEQVSYHFGGKYFLCHLVRSNSRCDTLFIPDSRWLDGEWR